MLGLPFCSVVGLRLLHECFGGDAEAGVEGADHTEAEGALAVEDFGDLAFAGDVSGEVGGFESELLHAKFDRFNGIGRWHGVVLGFVVFNQECP